MFKIYDKFDNELSLEELDKQILSELNWNPGYSYAYPPEQHLHQHWVKVFDDFCDKHKILSWADAIHALNSVYISRYLEHDLTIQITPTTIASLRNSLVYMQPYIDLINYFANKFYKIRSL